jgi:glycosyltransferase involved in cell wall biosynthesis
VPAALCVRELTLTERAPIPYNKRRSQRGRQYSKESTEGEYHLFRILYAEDAPSIGGSIVCLRELVSGLDRSKYEPFVLFRYDLPPAKKQLEKAGIPHATWASLRGEPEDALPDTSLPDLPRHKKSRIYRCFSSAKTYVMNQRRHSVWLAGWMEREGMALLHANNAVFANITEIVAASRARIPAISHERGFFQLTAVHRHLARRVQRYLCISNAVKEHDLRQGLPESKLLTIYDGVDTRAIAPTGAETRDWVHVGWFGRLEKWKGAATMIDAARIILGERNDVRFSIVGTGPEETSLRRNAAEDTVMRDRVNFSGYEEEAVSLLADCDILVNSSIEPEPLGHSVLEAAALGIPVVASKCGGLTEIVENGENGYLFEPGNAGELAGRLLSLIDDGALRRRLGANARRRAESDFSLERHVRAVETVYAEILERRT